MAVAALEIGLTGIILDAELTLATPDRLWLSSGMRAVDHAVGMSQSHHSSAYLHLSQSQRTSIGP